MAFWFAVIAILPLFVAGVIIHNQIVSSRKTSIFSKLEAIRDLKVFKVNNWLDGRVGDISSIASDLEIRILENIHEGKREYTEQNI
jgi:hypothetical protein